MAGGWSSDGGGWLSEGADLPGIPFKILEIIICKKSGTFENFGEGCRKVQKIMIFEKTGNLKNSGVVGKSRKS